MVPCTSVHAEQAKDHEHWGYMCDMQSCSDLSSHQSKHMSIEKTCLGGFTFYMYSTTHNIFQNADALPQLLSLVQLSAMLTSGDLQPSRAWESG